MGYNCIWYQMSPSLQPKISVVALFRVAGKGDDDGHVFQDTAVVISVAGPWF